MNNFEELENVWKGQSVTSPTEKEFGLLKQGIAAIEKKQYITNIILTITIVVLIAFALYVSGYTNPTFLIGISLMVVSLIVRIAIEIMSIARLRKIGILKHFLDFKEEIMAYYKNRKKVHYIITPICLLAYTLGFTILLPLFEKSLSYGFYLYIVGSYIIFLIVFSLFIFRQIRKELLKLKVLQADADIK